MKVTVLGLEAVLAMLCYDAECRGRRGLVLFLALLVVTSTPYWLYLICLTAVLSLMSRPSDSATGTQL